MIDTIIFDIGGVLCHATPTPLSDKWAERCGLSKAEFDEIVFNSPLHKAAASGKISGDAVWVDRIKRLKISSNELNELRTDYRVVVWDSELLNFIETLKPHYKLGILSDATSGAREWISEWIDFELFDEILFSYEAGMVKPNPDIYRKILGMLGATAVNTLFLDDRPHNVQAAIDLGMSSFEFTTTAKTIAQIQQLPK